jgi:hypothetical protein
VKFGQCYARLTKVKSPDGNPCSAVAAQARSGYAREAREAMSIINCIANSRKY